VRTSELGLLPPFLVDRRVSRVACLGEGFDKTCGCSGGDVESGGREDERSGEAASAYLIGHNVDEARNFLNSEDDVTLVREITVILSDFVLWGVETRWI
jgi:hypothetical protein